MQMTFIKFLVSVYWKFCLCVLCFLTNVNHLLGGGLLLTALPRKRATARRQVGRCVDDASDVDVMLVERLSALEDFMTQQGLEV